MTLFNELFLFFLLIFSDAASSGTPNVIDVDALNAALLAEPIASLAQKVRPEKGMEKKADDIAQTLEELKAYGIDIAATAITRNNNEKKERQAYFAVGKWNSAATGTLNKGKENQPVLVISFPGSKHKEDWWHNVHSCALIENPHPFQSTAAIGTVDVAGGFWDRYAEILTSTTGAQGPGFMDQILQAITASKPVDIIIAGHSLGGALSNICALDLFTKPEVTTPITLVTFGAPRCFERDAAKKFTEAFIAGGNKAFRIATYGDPVPALPPSRRRWKHAGSAFYLVYDWGPRQGTKWHLRKVGSNFWPPYEVRTANIFAFSHKMKFYRRRLHNVEHDAKTAGIIQEVPNTTADYPDDVFPFTGGEECSGKVIDEDFYDDWGCVMNCVRYENAGCVTLVFKEGIKPCSCHEGETKKPAAEGVDKTALVLKAVPAPLMEQVKTAQLNEFLKADDPLLEEIESDSEGWRPTERVAIAITLEEQEFPKTAIFIITCAFISAILLIARNKCYKSGNEYQILAEQEI